MVGLGIIPIGDEQTGGSAEENSEVGIGVEEPLASKSGIGNVGLARTIAGLEVLGARFEGKNRDSKRKPVECGPEARLAKRRNGGARHRDRG